jgi:hypothetical protein
MPAWRQKKKALLATLTSSDLEDARSHFGPVTDDGEQSS